MVQRGAVIVTRNGKEIDRFIPKEKSVSYLTDSLAGILKQNINPDMAKMDRLKDEYKITD